MNTSDPVVFVFATIMEAEPFIAAISVSEIAREPYRVFASPKTPEPHFLVLLCGMGPAAAADAVGYLIENYQPGCVINCGVAGSLSVDTTVGEVFQVCSVAEVRGPDEHALSEQPGQPLYLPLPLPGYLSEARLLSRSTPLFDPHRRAELAIAGDLIDMEGWALAATCRQHSLPCVMFKVVSDHADDRGTLQRNLSHTSRRLARFVTYHLEHLLTQDYVYESERTHIA